ncbi:MAG: hypothetical protein H6658_09510 [Ardenticatenaceae bacterium]|nr:hypothetical protein [Ardenticatenaceae bacterium]
MSVIPTPNSDPIAALLLRLHQVIAALPGTSHQALLADQLTHAARRLQGHSQKPAASQRQLALLRHDLAAIAHWLTFLVNNNIFAEARLAPLRQDINQLLTTVVVAAEATPETVVTPEATVRMPVGLPAPTLPPPPPENWPPEEVVMPPPEKNESKGKRRKTSLTKVAYEGQTYTWTGQHWMDEQYLKPPEVVLRHLNQRLNPLLAEEDNKITDISELITRSQNARNTQQYDRAERLARRILTLEPNSHVGAAILCAVLRLRSHPAQAIQETNHFLPTGNAALLTSRAAALCDLGRWEEAQRSVGQALAIQTSEEAFMVVKRIKAERPDLYS